MTEYYLMNKNKKLILFQVYFDETIGEYDCREVERYVEEDELPPKFFDVRSWLDQRNYAKHKEHLQRWLKEWQIDNMAGFIEMTRALSLNDSLWVKKAESDLTWEQVNLYQNEFTDVVSKTAFEKGLHGLKLSTTSPEFTSEGSFEKCWIQEEDGIYLYKKGSSGFANAGLEMYSEFYAAQYAAVLCDSYVDYDLVKYKGSIVSHCQMFTTEKEGFIPIYKYLNSDKYYDYHELLQVLESYGCAEDFRHMIILDAVIFNPDRHFGNFGFIVDNDTFEVLRFAPVFDHNMAMLARAMRDDLIEDSPYIAEMGHKIRGQFIPVAKSLLDDTARTRLQSLEEVPLRLHEKFNLPKERTDFLEKAVQGQIREILGRSTK